MEELDQLIEEADHQLLAQAGAVAVEAAASEVKQTQGIQSFTDLSIFKGNPSKTITTS